MKKYVCDVCGYIYDPEVGDPDNGIEPGTAFEDIPDEWVCPLCQVGKDEFSEVQLIKHTKSEGFVFAETLTFFYYAISCVAFVNASSIFAQK